MAQTDMFLKVTGQRTGEIRGESNDKTFTNQIEVADWSWGMKAHLNSGGQSTGRRQLAELKVVKSVDRSSTALMSVLSTNENLSAVVLTVRKAGGASAALPYFIVKLEKARLAEYTVESEINEVGSPVLVEHLSFAFQKITVDYTPQQGTGGGGGATTFTDDVGASS